MKLTETGESRVRGYLFVLERSLCSFLPREAAADSVREVESHIRERIEQVEPREAPRSHAAAGTDRMTAKAGERIEQVEGGEAGERRAEAALPGRAAQAGSERDLVERILAELGPPLRVAQAYSREMTLDEAVTTGRFVPVARALWHMATSSVVGFFWGLFVLIGWGFGLTFLVLAVLKAIFPNNVGLMVMQKGASAAGTAETIRIGSGALNFGAFFPVPPGAQVHGGYWIIPICLVLGFAIVIGTHRASRRMLNWLRARKSPAKFRVRVEVSES